MFRAVACIAALCAAASAAPWTVARTASFEVYSDAGASTARATLVWFEQLRAFFLRQTGLGAGDRAAVRVVVFRSAEEYREFRPDPHATAFYVGDGARDYIVMEQGRGASAAIAAHEYAHALMHAEGLKLPPWFSEGLADVFSSVRIGANSASIGGELPLRIETLRRSTWMPLAVLLSARESTDVFYAQSWALVHMLAFSPEYRDSFTDLVAALASGNADALSHVYGARAATMERDLRDWTARESNFRAVAVGGPNAPAPAAELSDVTPLQQKRILADLLLTAGDDARAAKLYRELPAAPDIALALGEIELRSADSAGALREWKRGIEQGTRDPKLCYRYAVLAAQAGVPDAEIRPVLRRAVTLDPGFDDARWMLALAENNAGDFEAGLRDLRAMAHVSLSRRYAWWSAAANALNELDRREEAKAAAHEADRFAATADEHAHAAELEYMAATDLNVRFVRDASGAAHMVTVRAPHDAAQWNPFVEPGDQMRRIEGTLESIDCGGTVTRIEVKSAGGALTLSIPDPTRVQMRNAPSEFTCGPQSAHVIVDYAAQNGAVRSVEFRER